MGFKIEGGTPGALDQFVFNTAATTLSVATAAATLAYTEKSSVTGSNTLSLAVGATLDFTLKASLTSDVTLQFSIEGSMTGPTSTAAEADWNARIAEPGTVWYHDFRSATEVDAFRWSNGYNLGNDPDDVHRPGMLTRVTSDGVTGGGCMEALKYQAGDSTYWYRPFSPLNTGSGKALDDPADSGNLTVKTWAPTDGGGQTAQWNDDDYGDINEGSFEGRDFYIQLYLKLDPRRQSIAFNGGKIVWITRTEQTLTDQELVTYYKGGANPDYAIYQGVDGVNGGSFNEAANDYSPGEHIYDEWVNYLYHVVPGRQNVDEGQVHVYRKRAAENAYSKIFQATRPFGYEYSDSPSQSWSAVILGVFHNNANLPEFWQRFDQVIFSKDVIPVPGLSQSALGLACDALSANQSASFSTNDPGISEGQAEWQTNFFFDPIRNVAHLVGKQAGTTVSWPHYKYDVTTNTWSQITSSLTGGSSQLGHIYGNTAFDMRSGNLFQQAGDARSNKFAYQYTSDNNAWDDRLPSGTFSSSAFNDTNNGIAYHPNLWGPDRGGLVVGQQNLIAFVDELNDTSSEASVGSHTYGTKEGGAVYWPREDCVIVGGSSSKPLARVDVNNGATPTVSNAGTPPISVQGASRGTDGSLTTGFGSLHVHPGDPNKLLLLETAGPRAYEGTWTGSSISWASSSNHPFTNPGMTPRVVAPLFGLGCLWAVGNDGSNWFSHLWRPPV